MNENIFYYNEKKSKCACLYECTIFQCLNKKKLNGNVGEVQLVKSIRRFAILSLIMLVFWHPVLQAQTNLGSFKFLYYTSVSSGLSSSVSSRIGFLLSSPAKSISRNNFLFERNFKGINITNNNKLQDIIHRGVFLYANLQHEYNEMLKMSLVPEELDENNSQPYKNTEKDKSFFSNNLFYFVGAAVIAVTVYLLWPKKESPANSNTTFGVPPLPH